MSTHPTYRLASGVLVLLAACAVQSRAQADTYADVKRTCPVCDQQYETRVPLSETRRGMRLDLRPVGFLTAPHPIGVCPKCGFVDFMHGEAHDKEELKALKEFVVTDEYKKLVQVETPYYRVAKLYERLKRPNAQIATAYLQASWEVDSDKKRTPQYLADCLAAYEKVIADNADKPDQQVTPQFLKGEFLRRLGKFDEAKRHFEGLKELAPYHTENVKFLIETEIGLIESSDDRPHLIPPRPAKEKEKE